MTPCGVTIPQWVNILRTRQNGCHFADDTFNRIFVNDNIWILIKISLKCIPKGPINNIPTLVQIMAWRRPGDKPLSELMMVSLRTHICVTRPHWVKLGWKGFNYKHGKVEWYVRLTQVGEFFISNYIFIWPCASIIPVSYKSPILDNPCGA